MDVAALTQLLVDDYRLHQRASLRQMLTARQHLLQYFGQRPIGEITRRSVLAFVEVQRTRYKPATINRQLAVLRRSWTLALRDGLDVPSPPPHIPHLQADNARIGFLAPEEYRRLVKALDTLDPVVADIVRWLYLLGWRRSEVLGLQWSECDVADGTVCLPAARSKNRRSRRIYLPPELHEVLRRRWSLRRIDYVFHRHGRPVSNFRRPWRDACHAIGRPELIPHDLRRSFARNALAAGLDEVSVMALAGWKTRSMFERYAVVPADKVRSMLSAVAAYVDGDHDDEKTEKKPLTVVNHAG